MTFRKHEAGVGGIAFNPNGKIIATASDDKTIKLWKTDGTLLQTLKGHQGRVEEVAFSPDGKRIASASEDNKVGFGKSS